MLLRVEDLKTYFYTDDGIIPAVDGVSFTLNEGETVGIVGGVRVRQKYDSVINITACPATDRTHC